MINIKHLTLKLANHLEKLKTMYEHNEKPDVDRKFFNKVKAETEPIFNQLEKWEKVTNQYIDENKSSLYPQQITATKENMEALILHSYYIDVRKRRYMEIYKSCNYIFSQQLEELHDENTH